MSWPGGTMEQNRSPVNVYIQRQPHWQFIEVLSVSSNTSLVCSIWWQNRSAVWGSELNCFCECSIKFSSEVSLRFLSTYRDRCWHVNDMLRPMWSGDGKEAQTAKNKNNLKDLCWVKLGGLQVFFSQLQADWDTGDSASWWQQETTGYSLDVFPSTLVFVDCLLKLYHSH